MSANTYVIVVSIIIISVTVLFSIITFRVIKKELKKSIKADISINQMENLEQKINELLCENNLMSKYSIEEVAKVLNVECDKNEANFQKQAFVREDKDTGKKIIIFKRGLSEEEKRFAFVHELGHIINGDTMPATRPLGKNKDYREQLADYTAAALLMPKNEVYKYLQDNNYSTGSSKNRVRIVKKLRKQYNVSEMMVLRRIQEIQILENG